MYFKLKGSIYMKSPKRILSVFLALTLIFAMAMPTFAAKDDTPSVNWDALQEWWNSVTDSAKNTAEEAQSNAEQLAEDVKDGAEKAAETVKENTEKAADNVQEAFDSAKTKVETKVISEEEYLALDKQMREELKALEEAGTITKEEAESMRASYDKTLKALRDKTISIKKTTYPDGKVVYHSITENADGSAENHVFIVYNNK